MNNYLFFILLACITCRADLSYGAGTSVSGYESIGDIRWCQAPSMREARYNATATKLADGTILVVGGRGKDGKHLASAELYDPIKNSWTDAGSMNEARIYHTANLLSDGRVLIAGGINLSGAIASTEIYTPREGWKSLSPLNDARREASTFLLENGMVLVAGGSNPYDSLKSAEVFDPIRAEWSLHHTLSMAISNFSTAFSGGQLYIVGGEVAPSKYSSQLAIADSRIGYWRSGPSMEISRSFLSSDILNDQLIVIGGYDGVAIIGAIEMFDINNHRWKIAGSLMTPTFNHRTVVIPESGILVIGGVESAMRPTSRVELFSPGKPGVLLSPLQEARYGFFLITLDDSRILVGGGASKFNAIEDSWLRSVEISCESIVH